jgi:hypothetical protein
MSDATRAVPISFVRPQASDARSRRGRLGTSPPQKGAGEVERFQCKGCGDVIGVYEPLVVCGVQSTRTTSRAAEPDLRGSDGAHYHRDCYTEM